MKKYYDVLGGRVEVRGERKPNEDDGNEVIEDE